jgi:transcriptional regulator with XRE-family HTH domain
MKGRELRAIRKRLGWSQAQLAEAVGVASNSIARQERGEIGIRESLSRLVRLIAEQRARNETAADTRSGRRNSSLEPTKDSKSRNSQGKGGKRTRKSPVQ